MAQEGTAEVIQGLKIQIGTDELREHLEARQEHHHERALFYRRNIDSLRAGGVRPEHGVSNDPTGSLEGSYKTHVTRRNFFEFIVKHLVPNETYELSELDLSRIEILDRYM